MRKHFTAYKQEPDKTLQNYLFMNIYAKFGSELQKKSGCTANKFIYWLGYMCKKKSLT